MIVPDNYVIDCIEVLSTESLDLKIFRVDVCSEADSSRDTHTEFADRSWPVRNVDADFSSAEPCPEALIPGHVLSYRIEWTNSTDAFEQDLLSIDLDPESESAGRPRAGWFESRSARPSAFLTSTLVHVAVFFLFAFFSATQVAGTPGYAGNVLAATILSHEDLVPQDESPASVDSPASAPSIAKQMTKLKEPQLRQEPPEQAIDMQEKDPRTSRAEMLEKPNPLEKKEERKEPEIEVSEAQQDPRGDGLRNSLASMPSTASAERRFIPAAGQGGEAFDSLVLSAIRESIFFPKQAAQERQHGEVVVAFSINKERSISSLGVTKSSGSTILDEAAIKIIQKAAKKFPPFPDGLSTDALHFVVPILFKEKVRQ
jgi:periplasmic protein TonB